MSKYLCQDCKSNNNGWCTVRKCNGLKKMNISSCNTFEDKNVVEFTNGSSITAIENSGSARGKRADLKPVDEVYDLAKDNSEAYRVLGKREMLWKIQMQILGIDNNESLLYEDKYNVLVESIKSIGTHLEFEEKLWEVENIVDSIIDNDMIKASKRLNELI